MEPVKKVKTVATFKDTYQQVNFLEKSIAAYRSKQIEGVLNYKVLFQMQKQCKTFEIYQEVTFNLKKTAFEGDSSDQYFFIDLDTVDTPEFVQINGIVLNQQEIQENWSGKFFNFNKQLLKVGESNLVIFKYQNQFVTDGYGLYSFTDVDQKQYIYSHLEPNFCHKVFADFDQPDLKATYEIAVVTPKTWENIANGLITGVKPATQESLNENFKPINQLVKEDRICKNLDSENHQLIIFEKTLAFSTYIFFLGAGDFSYIELEESKCYNKIPQRMYVRDSLKGYLQEVSDKMFETVNKLIPFYEKFFHFNFPWSKYDHIFVPDFNINAMENVGAVTFTDRRVPREPQTPALLSQTLNVFAHELVHTWFGDIVTMQWWDDLWLKESFADYLSFYAINELDFTFKMSEQWPIFNTRKAWGYDHDSKNSTHSIAGNVQNTEAAKSVFDGITYAKGAATVKQLMFLLGADNFSTAMGSYFKKYNFSCATLQNFLDCLQEQFNSSQFTLQDWSQQWLIQPGHNIIQAEFDQQSKNNTLTIKQTHYLENFKTLRYHKIKVGLFKESGEVDVKEIILDNKETNTIEFDNTQNYKGLILNYDDMDFVRARLDKQSLEFFSNLNISKIQKQLDQKLIVSSVFEQVVDGEIPAQQYVDFVINQFQNTQFEETFEAMFANLEEVFNLYTPDSVIKTGSAQVFEALQAYLQNNKEITQGREVVAKRSLIKCGVNKQHFEIVLNWFKGQEESLKHVKITVDNQWNIVILAHKQKQLTEEEKQVLFDIQAQNDKSDTTSYRQRTCSSILDIASNDGERQEKRWQSFMKSTESKYLLEAAEQGFNQPQFKENMDKYYNKYFNQDVIDIFNDNSVANAIQFARNIFPKNQEYEWQLQQVENTIPKVPTDQLTLLRFLKDQRDQINRQLAIQKRFYSQK